MRLRLPVTRWSVAVAAGALVMSIPAVAAETDVELSGSDAARQTPTVSIPVRTVTSPGRDGENGTILMRVGRSAPIRVIVDTGFSGLIVFPGAWDRRPAGVRQSTTQVSFRPAILGRVRGVKGSAPMTFNGVTTTVDIPFVAATNSNAYIRQWTNQGVYGLLGVGTKGAGLVNPLSALPGVLGLRWSIHFQRTLGDRRGRPGEIVLGADPPLESTMSMNMPYLGQNVNGAALWDDHATPGCWRFGPRPEVCLPTQLDSAFNITRVKGARFRSLPTNSDDILRSGTLVRWAEPGSAFTGIRYRAGNRASVNLTRVIPRGKGQIIVGNDLYFENVVTYNTVLGKVYISDPR
ncbi:MAG: hypothetical protein O2815_11555 [Actinomycetota bacterium]|nr:hypothetical protein [Actinomycetota bacterium]